jgi:tetratricopeptide (TPR) repeat protein
MLSRKHIYAQEVTPFADENIDDLEDVSDEFQESFFEALKQKAIQNHDRAISALNKCIQQEPDRAILYFERAKNQGALKQYDLAEQDLIKALELDPNREPMLALLYDVYYKTRDYTKAEIAVKKLILFNTQYKEDLARIYTQTKKFEEAIVLLDELDVEKGMDLYRQQLRARIYKQSGNGGMRIRASEAKIAADPNNEAEYLKLIFFYSEEGNNAKAYETALKLQKINPEADEVQLALYKFYMEGGKMTEAIQSMNTVLRSTRMDGKAKHRVLNDFLSFVNDNPTYQPQLEEAIAIFDTQVADANVYQQLANYHLKKGEKIKGLKYFEKALIADSENLELIKNTVLLQLDTQQYESATKTTIRALDLFPSQPILYLTQGVAYNKLEKYDAAIESLEIGIDYIIENKKMESDFYQQLGEAYAGKGNTSKARTFLEKSKSLKAQLD